MQPSSIRCPLGLMLLAAGWSCAEAQLGNQGSKHHAPAAVTSSLWGSHGELYKTGLEGRLLDYSYAGYLAGERDIPDREPTPSVKDFGACGDGISDDSQAFLDALTSLPSGSVLYIPEGRYLITKQLAIQQRISLKGAGSHMTSLLLPLNLSEALGRNVGSDPQMGFIDVQGTSFFPAHPGALLTHITAPAARGSNILQVECTHCVVGRIEPNDWISITLGQPDPFQPERFTDMNHGISPGCEDHVYCTDQGPGIAYTFQTRVSTIINETTLVIERPLPWNITDHYKPWSVWKWDPHIAFVGIEGLTLDFTNAPRYAGHFHETGLVGIVLHNVAHSWIRDVHIIDCDTGILLHHAAFVTVANITIEATAHRANSLGETGHHGIWTKRTVDTVISHFDIRAPKVHDVSVDVLTRGTVVTLGRGVDLDLDNHRAQSYGVLYTQIALGKGTKQFTHSGSGNRGSPVGSFATWWNMQAGDPDTQPAAPYDWSSFGPYLNFVGTKVPHYEMNNVTCTWLVESSIPPQALYPQNIWAAQRALRLSSPGQVSTLLGGVPQGQVPADQLRALQGTAPPKQRSWVDMPAFLHQWGIELRDAILQVLRRMAPSDGGAAWARKVLRQ